MSVSEETASIRVVLLKATELLDMLNDAIERVVRAESRVYLHGQTRSGSNPPADHGKNGTSSDVPGEFSYSKANDASYAILDLDKTAKQSAVPVPVAKGESKLLSDIREALSHVEEQLYKVQELHEHQEEERSLALQSVDQKRELLLQLLQQHHGMEWEVVHDVIKFCGGDPEEPADDLGGSREQHKQQQRLPSGHYKRSLVSPFSVTQATSRQNQSLYSQPVHAAETDGSQPTSEDEDGAQEEQQLNQSYNIVPDVRQNSFSMTSRAQRMLYRHPVSEIQHASDSEEDVDSADGAEGDGEVVDGDIFTADSPVAVVAPVSAGSKGCPNAKKQLSASIFGLPGAVLGLLGDVAGHVANFGVKVAVVGLGVAAVLSLGRDLAIMYDKHEVKQKKKNYIKKVEKTAAVAVKPTTPAKAACVKMSAVGDKVPKVANFECTIRERIELKHGGSGCVDEETDVFMAMG